MNKRLKKIKLNPVRYYSRLIKDDPKGIDLTMGEGHFDSPFNAKLKAYEALLTNDTKYGPIEGDEKLRKTLIEKYYPTYQADKEIIITNGCTQALFSVLLSIITSSEDEIIIIAPYYPAYLKLIDLLGGKAIIIDSGKYQFKVNPEVLEEVITEKTKAIIINEPNNPTGVTYTKAEKDSLLTLFKSKSYYIIVDEIYKQYTTKDFVSFSELINNDDLKKRFFFINGLSKSHMMTGYRIGYVVCDELMNRELRKINYLSVSCISTIMQKAALGALEEECFVQFVRKYYLNNLNTLLDSLKFLKIKYVEATCGYYVFIDVSPYQVTGVEFCQYFIKNYHVALVPGILFGDSYGNYIRVSCCKDIKDIIRFINCLTEFVESNKKV
ncbi:pyridoxal phosphate-dependent aminotransferase [Mycoplasmatota bacterium]|nr:pyridoxal phosphate-dependent aminotransferase [Mycoplasmatota bacterium]